MELTNIQKEKVQRENKILISHATADKVYMELFVDLLETMRFPSNAIICSSIPGYGIPGGKKIYAWLKEQLLTCNLHVIFALSENYYKSPACLNEMGATWVTKSADTLFLLPNFKFESIKGCVDSTEVGISIDSPDDELKYRLNELKNNLQEEFSLEKIEDIRWERARDKFISEMREIGKKQENLTELSKSPVGGANSNKKWVGTCLYQEECKLLLINCGAVIRL